jgi:hypothetical protein
METMETLHCVNMETFFTFATIYIMETFVYRSELVYMETIGKEAHIGRIFKARFGRLSSGFPYVVVEGANK